MNRIRSLDRTELALVIAVTAVLTMSATLWWTQDPSVLQPVTDLARQITANELTPLAAQYGPDRVSQFAEEWIVRDFFKDRRDGVFLDVGANHYRNHSTTFYLETALGWSGLAIDAQAQYAADYRAHRPRTTFLAAFVTDRDEQTVNLYIPKHRPLNASGARPDEPHETVNVQTATLTRILDTAGVPAINFMNLDIEGFEPQALAGFDIARFRPALVLVESHQAERQAVLNYFYDHHYIVVGQYLRIDPLNLYFMPR